MESSQHDLISDSWILPVDGISDRYVSPRFLHAEQKGSLVESIPVFWQVESSEIHWRTRLREELQGKHTHMFFGVRTLYTYFPVPCRCFIFSLSIESAYIYTYIYISPHIPFKRCLKCFSVNFQGSAWCPARNPRWVALARDGRWECGNTDFFGFFMEDIRCYKQKKGDRMGWDIANSMIWGCLNLYIYIHPLVI